MNFFLSIIYLVLSIPPGFEGIKLNPANSTPELRFVSESQEVMMGETKFPQLIRAMGGESNDSELSHYVQAVGYKLARESQRPHLPYEFVVTNTLKPTAACLAGGKIVISRGMLLTLKNEAQLAAILAHEIAHANLRHSAKTTERILFNKFFDDFYIFDTFFTPLISRSYELEADKISIEYLSKAGYNLEAATQTLNSDNSVVGFFSKHPSHRERIEQNKLTIKNFPSGQYLGFSSYKKLLLNIKNGN